MSNCYQFDCANSIWIWHHIKTEISDSTPTVQYFQEKRVKGKIGPRRPDSTLWWLFAENSFLISHNCPVCVYVLRHHRNYSFLQHRFALSPMIMCRIYSPALNVKHICIISPVRRIFQVFAHLNKTVTQHYVTKKTQTRHCYPVDHIVHCSMVHAQRYPWNK